MAQKREAWQQTQLACRRQQHQVWQEWIYASTNRTPWVPPAPPAPPDPTSSNAGLIIIIAG
jgi:hypothetical protein